MASKRLAQLKWLNTQASGYRVGSSSFSERSGPSDALNSSIRVRRRPANGSREEAASGSGNGKTVSRRSSLHWLDDLEEEEAQQYFIRDFPDGRSLTGPELTIIGCAVNPSYSIEEVLTEKCLDAIYEYVGLYERSDVPLLPAALRADPGALFRLLAQEAARQTPAGVCYARVLACLLLDDMSSTIVFSEESKNSRKTSGVRLVLEGVEESCLVSPAFRALRADEVRALMYLSDAESDDILPFDPKEASPLDRLDVAKELLVEAISQPFSMRRHECWSAGLITRAAEMERIEESAMGSLLSKEFSSRGRLQEATGPEDEEKKQDPSNGPEEEGGGGRRRRGGGDGGDRGGDPGGRGPKEVGREGDRGDPRRGPKERRQDPRPPATGTPSPGRTPPPGGAAEAKGSEEEEVMSHRSQMLEERPSEGAPQRNSRRAAFRSAAIAEPSPENARLFFRQSTLQKEGAEWYREVRHNIAKQDENLRALINSVNDHSSKPWGVFSLGILYLAGIAHWQVGRRPVALRRASLPSVPTALAIVELANTLVSQTRNLRDESLQRIRKGVFNIGAPQR